MTRACFMALCLLLSSCGGGSESGPIDKMTAALSSSGNTLRGTAAVGLALANAEVKVRCPSTNRAGFSITITVANPAVVTVSNTSDISNALIYDGQMITLASSGKLPAPLNSYQSYYVVNTAKSAGSLTQFNLSALPAGEPINSTNGATQNGNHTLVPSSVIERTVTTDANGIFEIDFGGAQTQTDYKALSPCVLEIANPGGGKLHSIALTLIGVANITPLTDALLATLVEFNDLDIYFSTFDETAAIRLGQLANANNIRAVWEKIKTGLIASGFDVSAINTNPITDQLNAATANTSGNGYDKLLDAIALRTKALGSEALLYQNTLGGKQNLINLIKLDSRGVALKNQFAMWADNGNEKDGTQWDCVHDIANGVYWEVKRNDPNHYRHKGFKYTWFDSGKLNGGDAGTELNGTCSGLPGTSKCNTENLIRAANSALLCGLDKWVLPSIESAKTLPLASSSSVLANTEYFPDMQSGPMAETSIWTRLPSANNAEGKYAWTFNLTNNKVEDRLKSSARPVRLMLPVKTLKVDITPAGLVKFSAQEASDLSIANGQAVTMRTTGYLPTPFKEAETYFVVNYKRSDSSFQLTMAPTATYTPLGCELDKTIALCTKDFVGPPLALAVAKKTLEEKNISTEGVVKFNSGEKEPVISNGDPVNLKIGSTTTKTVFVVNLIKKYKLCPDANNGSLCFDSDNSKYQLADTIGGNPISKAVLMTQQGVQFVVLAKPRAENPALTKENDFCNSTIEVTRDPSRYLVNATAGEVTDTVTNLVWQRCVYGLSGTGCDQGVPQAKTFSAAMNVPVEVAAPAVPDPAKDWRLPTRKELASLVERKCTGVWKYEELASSLWMSTRLFTQSGGWEQESSWSYPVLVASAGMAFSADGTTWHLNAGSADVFMGKVSSNPGQPIKVASILKIAGESGYGWRDSIPTDPKDGILNPTDPTPTPLWMTSATFSADGRAAPIWSAPVDITKGKDTLGFSNDGTSWHSIPQGTEVFMRNSPNDSSPVIIKGEVGGVTNKGATIKGVAFYRGNFPPVPLGGSYTSPTPDFPFFTEKTKHAMVNGVAFYRGTLPPVAPVGGSFAYPAPSSLGWSDGIPKVMTTANVISAADSAQAINPMAFPQAISPPPPYSYPYPQAIWTSDKIPNTDAAWVVNFYNGFEGYGDSTDPPIPPEPDPKYPRSLTYVRLVKNK